MYVCHFFCGDGEKMIQFDDISFLEMGWNHQLLNYKARQLTPGALSLLADFACMLQEVHVWMVSFLYFLCSCLKWGRCPHFWNSNPLIYLLTVFVSSKGCISPKGAKEGRMPVSTMMNVISSFSHSYGVVKTPHHPGVHGFSSPKFVDLPLAWLLEKEYDLFRMILNVLNWSFNSLKLFCRRRLDIVWWDLVKKILGPIRGKIQKSSGYDDCWLFGLVVITSPQNHKSRNTFLWKECRVSRVDFKWISIGFEVMVF